MSVANCARFVSECIKCEPGKQSGLREDEMYGVYLSWCFLNAEKPCSDRSLWAAMSQQAHLEPQRAAGQRVWPGLSMTGPAAVDYILSSQPSLL
jgi:hypothetical protein